MSYTNNSIHWKGNKGLFLRKQISILLCKTLLLFLSTKQVVWKGKHYIEADPNNKKNIKQWFGVENDECFFTKRKIQFG